jgi:transcriptional regulator with XRE-family HTH domain
MSTPTHLQHVGSNIKEMRKYRQFTQQQLADESGLRLATISDIENGKLNFEINTLVRIASALNCYLDISLSPVKTKGK